MRKPRFVLSTAMAAVVLDIYRSIDAIELQTASLRGSIKASRAAICASQRALKHAYLAADLLYAHFSSGDPDTLD